MAHLQVNVFGCLYGNKARGKSVIEAVVLKLLPAPLPRHHLRGAHAGVQVIREEGLIFGKQAFKINIAANRAAANKTPGAGAPPQAEIIGGFAPLKIQQGVQAKLKVLIFRLNADEVLHKQQVQRGVVLYVFKKAVRIGHMAVFRREKMDVGLKAAVDCGVFYSQLPFGKQGKGIVDRQVVELGKSRGGGEQEKEKKNARPVLSLES